MKIVKGQHIYPFEFHCSKKELISLANYCKLTNQFWDIYWGNFLENNEKLDIDIRFPLNSKEVIIVKEYLKIIT